MSIHYDLHAHSTASDGTLAPADLVRLAADQGVDVLALTDHDTTAGLKEAAQAVAACGISLAPGVEISVTWDRQTVHIVGLNVDPENDALQRGLAGLRAFRDWRAVEIGNRLARAGIADAYEGALALAGGAIVSRTHFAHFLVSQGLAESVRDVFRRFLVQNKPGHVPGAWAQLSDAVQWIRQAGGQAIIAHPARYRMTASKLRRLIDDFVGSGGEGIEVISGSHSRDEQHSMAAYARRYGLLASAGSDYHGPENPWIALGRLPDLPQGCKPVWESERWNRAPMPAKRSAVNGC